MELGLFGTLHDNAVIDALRVATVIFSGMILGPMLVVAWRTKNVGFYALAIFIFLTAVGEADQVGEPFVVYQLPLRLLGSVLAAYWLWKRRSSSTD